MPANNQQSVSHARDWFVTDATAAIGGETARMLHGTASPANSLSNQPLAAAVTLGDNPEEAPLGSGTAIAHFLT
jgi:hypothetical protein